MTPQGPPKGKPQGPPQGSQPGGPPPGPPSPTAPVNEAQPLPGTPPLPTPKPAARQKFIQLSVTEAERNRLRERIYQDFLSARSDHDGRIERFKRYYRMWRGLNVTTGNKDDGPDLQVPLIKWTVFGQWAKVMQALLGDDSEVVARPTAPADAVTATKAGAYMTWRVFEYMNATIALATWIFRSVLFGRGHAEIIYEQEYDWQRDDEKDIDFEGLDKQDLDYVHIRGTTYDHEVLGYDGPRLKPLWPSQFILPAQDNCERVDDFEWKIRRDILTPQQLLDGEARGKYQGITEHWNEIIAAAEKRQERDWWWDDERIDADEAEGVDHTNTLGNRDSLEVWRWYGKWRFPKGKRDSRPDNLKFRDRYQTETLVTYLPKVNLICGIQDLRDVYPRLKKRDPFVDISTTKDGSYWSPGLGELLEDLQNELTVNHALFRKAGFLSVGPIILFNPSGGWDPDVFTYEPGQAIPVQDPASVKTITFSADLRACADYAQTVKGYAELVDGVNDQSLGKAGDAPNTPRTASGQAMLLNEGNVRATLDMTMIREDLGVALNLIWMLDAEYADEKVFFRVTGEDAAGFDVNKGFGTLTAEDREHPMSFDMKFATSVWSKEAKKQYLLQLYGLSMQNPIVQTNPRALWTILNRLWEAFGEDNFREVVPEPPQPDLPKMPKDEWSELLRGDVVQVNPLDDDHQHILDHTRRLQQEMDDEPARRSEELEQGVKWHILQHERQMQQKQMMQHLMMQALQRIQAQQSGQPPAGAFPAAPPPGAAAPIAPPSAGATVPTPVPSGLPNPPPTQ